MCAQVVVQQSRHHMQGCLSKEAIPCAITVVEGWFLSIFPICKHYLFLCVVVKAGSHLAKTTNPIIDILYISSIYLWLRIANPTISTACIIFLSLCYQQAGFKYIPRSSAGLHGTKIEPVHQHV